MKNLKVLIGAINEILNDPKLAPGLVNGVDVTHCNQAIDRVAKAMDYYGLDGKTANEICDYLASSSDFARNTAEMAAANASKGIFVIAAHKYEGHGHVAVVYPESKTSFSGRWGCNCPLVANVGRDQKIEGANFAFPVHDTPPLYYALIYA